jgi:integrase
MPRSKNPVPSYSHHKPSDQAYVRIPDGNGGRRVVYLGKYGSPESQAEYRRILAELETGPPLAVAVLTAGRSQTQLTVNEVLFAFMQWAGTHYRTPDGEPTNEVAEIRRSIIPLRRLYGHTPAAEFGPKSLEAVRQHMVELDWCRTSVNHCVNRLKRVFKWAASQELVPVAVHQSLCTLNPLRAGRCDARESEPVRPVNPAHVAATQRFLTPHLRCMVELQRLTGMRPGEVCKLRMIEVDTTGAVWVCRPPRHKTAYRGKARAIYIGPRAQALIATFLRGNSPPPEGWGHVRVNAPIIAMSGW